MFKRFGFLLSFLALFLLMNGHLAILQGIAWTQMAIHYSEESNLKEGLCKTFDGNHPCPLCVKIAKSEKPAKKEVRLNLLKEMKFFATSTPALINCHFKIAPRFALLDLHFTSQSKNPLTPPPRSFFA